MKKEILCLYTHQKIRDQLENFTHSLKEKKIELSVIELENFPEFFEYMDQVQLPTWLIWAVNYDNIRYHRLLCEIMARSPEVSLVFWEDTGRHILFKSFPCLNHSFEENELSEKLKTSQEVNKRHYPFINDILKYFPLKSSNPGLSLFLENSHSHFYIVDKDARIYFYSEGSHVDFPGGGLPVGHRFSDYADKSLSLVIDTLLSEESGEQKQLTRYWEWEKDTLTGRLEITLKKCNDILFYLIFKDKTIVRQRESVSRDLEKFRAYGELAGGIVANMTNQIMGIKSYAVLLDSLVSQSRGKEYLDKIQDMADTLQSLSEKIFSFSTNDEKEWGRLDLRELLEESMNLYETGISSEITIAREFLLETAEIRGIRTLLQNCFLNLFLNARDAMSGSRGLLTVRLYRNTLNDHYSVEIHDTGSGMDEDTISRIFDPSFSTKEEKGTGMGLPLVKGTMELHGGGITVKSEPGRGTSFLLDFPEYQYPSEEDSRWEKEEEPLDRQILIIDDEALIRDALRTMLEAVGLNIIDFAEGRKGISYYKENRKAVALIILDILMPGMGGKEVFFELKQIDPDVKVLLLSGFSHDGDVQEMMEAGAASYLQKPVELKRLISEINRITGTRYILEKNDSEIEKPESYRVKENSSLRIKQALDRLNGNLSLYFKLCRDFIDIYGNVASDIDKILETGDRESAIVLIHSLKSLAGTLGADNIKQIAFLIERELMEKENYPIAPLMEELKMAYDEVKDEIAGLASSYEEEEIDPDKKRDSGNDDLWNDYYHRLKDRIEAGEPNESAELIKYLMKFTWRSREREEFLNRANLYISEYQMDSALALVRKSHTL